MKATLLVFTAVLFSGIHFAEAQQMSDFERGFLAGQQTCGAQAQPARTVVGRACTCENVDHVGATADLIARPLYSDGGVGNEMNNLGTYKIPGYLGRKCNDVATNDKSLCSRFDGWR